MSEDKSRKTKYQTLRTICIERNKTLHKIPKGMIVGLTSEEADHFTAPIRKTRFLAGGKSEEYSVNPRVVTKDIDKDAKEWTV